MLGKQLGFKQPKYSKALEESGLVSRYWSGKQIQLGSLLGKVTRTKRKKNKKKRKK